MPLRQVVPDREPGLTTADDHCLDVLCAAAGTLVAIPFASSCLLICSSLLTFLDLISCRIHPPEDTRISGDGSDNSGPLQSRMRQEASHHFRCRPWPVPALAWSRRSVYAPRISSVFRPVADVVPGRVVVPSVYLSEPGTVEVNRDGWYSRRVGNPVDTPLIRQHG